MNIETFLLFIATSVFGMFNLYTNIKAGDDVLKWVTLVGVYISIGFDLFLIVKSVIAG